MAAKTTHPDIRLLTHLALLVTLTTAGTARVGAQNTNPYADGLLQDLRASARRFPGNCQRRSAI